MKRIDLSGKTFGRLRAVEFVRKDGLTYWLCQCDCGKQKEVHYSALVSGKTKSCGCLNSDIVTARNHKHGKADTPEYATWLRMIRRCTISSTPGYENYGGRGISVHPRWMSFDNFYADMGDKPAREYSIDRIDNNGNYEPGNCRWATPSQQCRNTRRNRRLTLNGETRVVAEWAELVGLPAGRIEHRINALNWSAEKALTTPIRRKMEREALVKARLAEVGID